MPAKREAIVVIVPSALAGVHGGGEPPIRDFDTKDFVCRNVWNGYPDHAWGERAASQYMSDCLLRDRSAPYETWKDGVVPAPRLGSNPG